MAIHDERESRPAHADDAPTSETGAQPASDDTLLAAPAPDLAPGEMVGPYRILETLGEGGFGSVYLAEQQRPVRRKVALKVIKLGMDTRQVIARFEAERQALALMNHPNIARVLDAGATETGRPYFVMDLVQGVPITQYCDTHNLTLSERLRLFIDVCHAVQHAHQKGVIHRDIKPSNVLVGMQDGKPAPRIIDFGIAKATNQRLTERTLHTAQQHFVGTPQYMSPEQAEMSGLDIDTRSDIYSLGVLLYELLTGASPFDAERLQSASLAEIPQLIRDARPQRASTRVSTMGEKASGVAERRQASPAALRRSLKGDLDWITLKAIEKDRTRRYQTATELAQDIERFLNHEPVLAGPPSVVYRARKFAQRNKAAFAGGSVIAAALLVGLAMSIWGFYRASVERDAARIAQQDAERARGESDVVTVFLSEMLTAADPAQMGKDVRVRDALDAAAARIGDNFKDQPAIEGRLRQAIGDTYASLGLYDEAEQHLTLAASLLERSTAKSPDRWLSARESLASLRAKQGRFDEARSALERVIAALSARKGDRHPDTLRARARLGMVLESAGEYEESTRTLRAALEAQRTVLGREHPDTLKTAAMLAHALWTQGRFDDAEPIYLETLAAQRRTLGREHPDTLATLRDLALLRRGQGRYSDAEPLYLEAREVQERVLGPNHPQTLRTLFNLAWLYNKQGRFDEAEALYRDVLARMRAALGPEHPTTLGAAASLAQLLTDRGKLEEARGLLTTTLEAQRRTLGPKHPSVIESIANLALLHRRLGEASEADRLFTEALALQREALGPDHPTTLATMINLANLRVDQRRFDDAERLMREALAAQTRTLGADHPNTIGLKINLAGLLSRQNRLDEAERTLREVVSASSAALGEDHAYTMAATVSLAQTLRRKGDTLEAERLYLRGLEAQKRVLGDADVNTLRTMQNLASLYRATGRLDKAEALLREALAARERSVGPDHPETLSAALALALTRRDQGDASEAEALMRRALAGRAKALGEDHPDTQFALSTLANLLYQQNQPSEAGDLFTRWMQSRQRVFGERDGNALAMGYNLMLLRAQLNQMDEARRLALDLIHTRRALAEAPEAQAADIGAYAQLLLTCQPEDLRDAATAATFAARACELTDHKDPALLDTLAQALRLTGDIARAIETITQAIALLPEGDKARSAFEQQLAEYQQALSAAGGGSGG